MTLFSWPEYVLTTYHWNTPTPFLLLGQDERARAWLEHPVEGARVDGGDGDRDEHDEGGLTRSLRVGQVTLRSSTRTSRRNFAMLKPCFWPERVWARCLACAGLATRAWRRRRFAARPSRLPVCVESDFLPDPVWLFLTAFATNRSVQLAGLEGLEPPTPGFGDRCSTN